MKNRELIAEGLIMSGGVLALFLAAAFFYRFRSTLLFYEVPPYHWLAMSSLFALLSGFSYGTSMFGHGFDLDVQFSRDVFLVHSLPALFVMVASAYVAFRYRLALVDLLFLDVRSPIGGPASILLMLQPVLVPLWLGLALGKAMRPSANDGQFDDS